MHRVVALAPNSCALARMTGALLHRRPAHPFENERAGDDRVYSVDVVDDERRTKVREI